MLYIMVLAAVAAADGDASCATACARCDSRSATELATVYCALCRECRDRRREWLVTAAPFRRRKPSGSRNMAVRRMAPVQPLQSHYREDAYYRKDATWSEPRRHQPDCPPPPSCDDDEEIGYIKVYDLKRTTCPPARPCVTQTHAPRSTKYSSPRSKMTYNSPRPRHTQPSTSSIQPMYSNQCCPMFMPMMPYPCVCPFGVFAPGPGIFGIGAGAHYPRLRAVKPGGPFGPSLGAIGHSQATSDSTVSTTQSTTQTEPVYLYIGIPKEMKSLVDSQR